MSTSSVYDQHRKHTARVGAYAVLHKGEHVASVTIAYPKDGASRLYAYVHWIGTPMIRGWANGYGYDKRTAAVASAAAQRIKGWDKTGASTAECMFWEYAKLDNGYSWDWNLVDAGFTIVCVSE